MKRVTPHSKFRKVCTRLGESHDVLRIVNVLLIRYFFLPVSQVRTKESILFSIKKGSDEQEQHTGFSDVRNYGPVFRYGHDFVNVIAPNAKDSGNNCYVQLNSRWFHDPSKHLHHASDSYGPSYVDEIEAFGFEK